MHSTSSVNTYPTSGRGVTYLYHDTAFDLTIMNLCTANCDCCHGDQTANRFRQAESNALQPFVQKRRQKRKQGAVQASLVSYLTSAMTFLAPRSKATVV